ncbi:MAG: hypothetical protein ABJA20_10375 [Novosphingobium sp.]
MARSVSSPSGAQVAYRDLGEIDAEDADWEYNCLCEHICAEARRAFPSFELHDGWRGREDRILLRNSYADIGLSIYGSIAAIWIAERDDPAYWDRDARTACSPRAQHWLHQITPRFMRAFGELERIGCMSNGESVYRRVAEA